MKTEYLFYFILSFILTAIVIPAIIILSKKFGLFDYIDSRKIHNKKISRLGGLGIFLCFLAVSTFIFPYSRLNFNIYLYFSALVLSFLIGFFDDIKTYNSKIKLILQLICAALAVSSGLLIKNIDLFGLVSINFGYFSYVITAGWIILFMNAINLIDGMDGLASGLIFTANIFICIIGFLIGDDFIVSVSLALGGAILGFIIFNFPPAKIFMGDGGAYFLGFVYATIPLTAINHGLSSTIYIFPFIIMLLPITDLIHVAIIRLKDHKSIFSPDNNHLHHRLLKMGFSNVKIVLFVNGFTALLGIMSLILCYVESKFALLLFFSLFFITALLFNVLKDMEKKFEENSQSEQVVKGIEYNLIVNDFMK